MYLAGIETGRSGSGGEQGFNVQPLYPTLSRQDTSGIKDPQEAQGELRPIFPQPKTVLETSLHGWKKVSDEQKKRASNELATVESSTDLIEEQWAEHRRVTRLFQ